MSLLITPRYRYKSSLLQKTEDIENLRVFRVGFLCLPYTKRRFISPFLKLTLSKIDSLFHAYIRIRKGITFDIIHIHSDQFSFSLGFKLSKLFKRPFIVTVHQKFGRVPGDIEPDYQKYERMLSAAGKIIVHRRSTQRVLESWGLAPRTVFIPMFIDVAKYRKPNISHFSDKDIIRLLFLGHLGKRKDPLTLLHAFSNTHKHHPLIELHIVGEGLLKKQVISLIRRYGLERNVFLHDLQLDIRRYLWRSDIFISTNIVDNYPSLALREAMAAGLVPVVTDVGETRELIYNGVNGLLVPPSDPVALSNALITLIEDAKLRKKLSLNAQLSSVNFDITNCIQPLVKIYQEILGHSHT